MMRGQEDDWEKDYLNNPGKLDAFSLASTEDSESIKSSAERGPREMTLIPYLIAKGHYQESERVIRVAIEKPHANEGEGLLILSKLLSLQAEMYKFMGLFPLALGLLMDCVDLYAALVGYDDSSFHHAVCLVTSLLRKMKAPLLIKRYLQNICETMTQVSNNPVKGEEADKIVEADEKYAKRHHHGDLWRRVRLRAPQGQTRRRLWHIYGLGGLYNLYTTTQGHCIAARQAFESFCERESPEDLLFHVRFITQAFRLRLCENDEIFRYIMTNITQKHVAKRFVNNNPVARIYHDVTSQEDKAAVKAFLFEGLPVELEVLDRTVEESLKALQPAFKRFFLSEEGALLRTLGMDVDAELAAMAATKMQSVARIVLARIRVKKVQAMRDIMKGRVKL